MKKTLVSLISVLILAGAYAYAGPYGPSGGGGSISHNQSGAADWQFGMVSVGAGGNPGQIKQDTSNNLEFYDPVVGVWWTLHQLASGAGGSMIYPGAGLPNSTGSAWGTSYSSSNQIPFSMLAVTPANLGLVIGTNVEAWSSVLDSFEGVTPATGYLYWNGSGFQYQTPSGGGGSSTWGAITGTLSNQSDLQTALSGKQAASSNLTTYSGIAPSSNAQTLLGETFSQMLSSIGAVSTSTTVNGHALSSNATVTASDVGLGNVTNNAQVKKITSSVSGDFMSWSGTTGDTPADSGYSASSFQAASSNLTTWAGINPGGGVTTALSNGVNSANGLLGYNANLYNIGQTSPSTGFLEWNGAAFVYASPYTGVTQNGSGGISAPGTNSFGSVTVGSTLSSSIETPVTQWYCTDSASNAVLCGELTLQMTSNTSGGVNTVLRRYDLVNGTLASLEAASTQTIASGTAALGTTAISSGACASVVTMAATGVLTTDAIGWSFNAAPPGGYNGTGGVLAIQPYVTGGNVNFLVCNPTASSITPSAATLNWRVVR